MVLLFPVFTAGGAIAIAGLYNSNRAYNQLLESQRALDSLALTISFSGAADGAGRTWHVTGNNEPAASQRAALARLDERLAPLRRFAQANPLIADDLMARLEAALTERSALLSPASGDRTPQRTGSVSGPMSPDASSPEADPLMTAAADLRTRIAAFGSQHADALRSAHWLATAGLVATMLIGLLTAFALLRLARRSTRSRGLLHDERERLRQVIDSMFPFVGLLSADGRLQEVNRALLEIAGLARADVLGRHLWNAGWWRLDVQAQQRIEQAFTRAAQGEPVRFDDTITVADGSPMSIDLMLKPVFAGERLRFVIFSATDITVRKQLEQALLDADRRKDDFLAMLAHELRNPLPPLRIGLELIRRQSAVAPAIGQVTEMMVRQLSHLVRLVDDLLDLSRVVQGRIYLNTGLISLESVIHHAVDTSRPLVDLYRHQLEISLPGEPLMLEADETRIAQVVTNLLNNAAKYTPEGGQIRLSAIREGREAVIRVADNGIGIDADKLETVFDMFAKADRPIDRERSGLGIGLSVARHLVELHGGMIEAQSSGQGQGATFTVRVPVAA